MKFINCSEFYPLKIVFIITICTLILFENAVGQDIQNINGIVKDDNGMTMPGVNVTIKGTDKGAITDTDGNYSLKAKKGDTLIFSFIGFEDQELIVADATKINIVLAEGGKALEEVVVVGYGIQTKKEVTGAVTVVGSETIEELQPVRVEQALQGQVAGVQINSNSGSPGSASTISIRGVATNGDNKPLILVDGNVIEDLSVINPGDIASVNVLKDASAGIYGVRAANGVILITTKTGRKNTKLKFTADGYLGIQSTTRKIPVLNGREYVAIINEANVNGGSAPPFSNYNGEVNTDWQDKVFQNAKVMSLNLGTSGGTKKSTYAFGLSGLTQDGIVGGDKSNFTRMVARGSFGTEVIKNLSLTSTLIYTFTDRKTLNENSLGSVLFNTLNMAPTMTVTDSNGNYTKAEGLGNEVINPLAQISNTHNKNIVNKISGTLGLQYTFLKDFEVKSAIQFNFSNVNGNDFKPTVDYGSGKVFNITRNVYTENNDNYRDYTWDNYLTYTKSLNDHNIKVLLGASAFKTEGNLSGSTGYEIPDDDYGKASIANAKDVVDNYRNGGDTFDARLSSYFTRLQYNYKQKYLISGVLRRDGSTKFGPKNKFGLFPSMSVAWVASDEQFLKGIKALSFMKFRFSYGILGNDRIDDFQYVSLLNGEGVYIFDNELKFGKAAGVLGNPEIRWERQKTYDIGLDMGLWNDKINITIDYFNKRTEDLLVTSQVSGILGADAPGSAAPVSNAGIVENAGVEFQIGLDQKINKDVSLNISYNFTTLKNNVVFVDSENGFIPGGNFSVGQDPPARMEKGKPIGYFYGYKTDGIFQNQEELNAHATQTNAGVGDFKFKDLNNDGVIDEKDKTDLGNPIPDITMGLNLSINYKNIDLTTYSFASIGNDIIRNYERNQPRVNKSVYSINRWTGEGSTNTNPKVTTGKSSSATFSDYYVEDGSYLRIQNLQIGYTFGGDSLEKLGLDKLRTYVSVNNLYTFTKYRGYDPAASTGEPIGGGIDYGFYPVPRTIIFGVNVKF